MPEPREASTPDPCRSPAIAKPKVAVLGHSLESEILVALESCEWTKTACRDGAALLESVVERMPGAVVVALEDDRDLGILPLLRRLAPRVPLIVLTHSGDLRLQRILREVRPYYCDVVPFDADELREVVRLAVRPRPGANGGEAARGPHTSRLADRRRP